MPKTTALIVAAGRGTRAAGAGRADGLPKQYIPLANRPLLAHTLQPFLQHTRIDAVRVVIGAGDRHHYTTAINAIAGDERKKLAPPIIGADNRQASVLNGLEALAGAPASGWVLIHDAARPFITASMLDSLLNELQSCRGAILATRATDTIKVATPGLLAARTLPRETLWHAETPQAFRIADILDAHRRAALEAKNEFTDDASIAEWAGIPVALVESGGGNTKITSPEDLAMAEQRLGATEKPALPDIRTGQGFDVHRFKPGNHVWLCGIKIPHDQSVEAHSDGDVALHALTDALLGAIADGDIGQHFKNSDPRWKNAASHQFVSDAVLRIVRRGAVIRHVDVTILSEAPKIAPYREPMRAEIARLTGLSLDRIGLKATTTEGLGFIGRNEGLAALATATVAFRATAS